MQNRNPIVVAGAGQCGLKAVETLRQAGYDRDLILIGEEPSPPYQRPPLSKAFLKGELVQERLMLTGPDFFVEQDVDTRFGTKLMSIDTRTSIADLSDGTQVPFSQLLLATGSRARTIDLTGVHMPEVYSLRTLADAARLATEIRPSSRIAIVGGGYIGLEVAASTRALGHSVTVLEGADRILKRVVCPQVSEFFESLHRRNGVDIRTSVRPTSIRGEGKVEAIELSNGEEIGCDVVLVAVGGAADIGVAEASGLAVSDGVVVDVACRTSVANIFAAGDCAMFPSKKYDRSIRLESVQNAIDQGRAAAQAMLGEAIIYDPVPWFWSDQFDVKLQIAGLSQGYDCVETAEAAGPDSFAANYFKDGELICVDSINHPRAHMIARRALSS